ncbi:RNase adapter RapZ [Actinomyces vulturis]|uniref:RNase adapter RapZ n=1 Tax=Actinomyces vulturis TaxID=1857645 RepID=UPI000B213CD8|nr:RNase adapter RapZ [Actinomyces vulturis]
MTDHNQNPLNGTDVAASSDETVPHGIPILDEVTPPPAPAERPEMMIITGMSGAGRSRAAMVLEDLDWYVVDNLPPQMLPALAGMMTTDGTGVHRLAVVVDVRSRDFFGQFIDYINCLRDTGVDYRILFLDASDAALIRRFESSRRPHPLQSDGSITEGIAKERELLDALRQRADMVIDTSAYSVHDLARKVRDLVAKESELALKINVMSFGFKYGIPLDADDVLDVRFIPNPYWVTELRHLTGRDEPVSSYVFAQDGAVQFVDGYTDLLIPVLPRYVDELKPNVTIAVGCTGGKHRSVASAERISARLREAGFAVRTYHRDLGRE